MEPTSTLSDGRKQATLAVVFAISSFLCLPIIGAVVGLLLAVSLPKTPPGTHDPNRGKKRMATILSALNIPLMVGLVVVAFATTSPEERERIAAGDRTTTTIRRTTTTERRSATTAESVTSTSAARVTTPPAARPSTTSTRAPAAVPTTKAPATTTTQRDPFPPQSLKDLGALGSTSAVASRDQDNEPTGLPACQKRRVQIVVPRNLADRELTQVMARAYLDTDWNVRCGGVVFAYYDRSEYDDVYTAGRLIMDGPWPDEATEPGTVEINGGGITSGGHRTIATFNYRVSAR